MKKQEMPAKISRVTVYASSSNALADSLPGGSGTFEEVFEVLTMKRLGQFLGPIILVNTNNYYDRLVDFLEHSVSESFMSRLHLEMWSLIDEPEQVLDALSSAKTWSSDAFKFAAVASTS